MIKVAIIGAGRGGTSLIEILHNDPFVKVIGVVDLDRQAPGMKLARSLSIPTTTSYKRFLHPSQADIIIDVTGNPEVEKHLLEQTPPGVSVIGGPVAKFMWQLIDQQIRSKQETERHLVEYQSLYRLYMNETRHAIDEERARIAMEIHDGLVQTLVGLNYKLDLCHELLNLNPTLGKQTLKETQGLLKQAIEETRQVIFNLKPMHGERMKLVSALKHHLKTFQHQYGIQTALKVRGQEDHLQARSKIFLFRIIQEALSNVQKHAKASRVEVGIHCNPTALKATIRDNGIGFDLGWIAKDPAKWTSFGLQGIEERARLLGGSARIESRVGYGTAITVQIPLPEQEPKILETGQIQKNPRHDRG